MKSLLKPYIYFLINTEIKNSRFNGVWRFIKVFKDVWKSGIACINYSYAHALGCQLCPCILTFTPISSLFSALSAFSRVFIKDQFWFTLYIDLSDINSRAGTTKTSCSLGIVFIPIEHRPLTFWPRTWPIDCIS